MGALRLQKSARANMIGPDQSVPLFFKPKSEQTGPLCWEQSIWWDACGAVKAVTSAHRWLTA
jgi:hypothetical protein